MMEVPNLIITAYCISMHVFFFFTVLKTKTQYKRSKNYILTSLVLLMSSLLALWGVYYMVRAEDVIVDVKLFVVQMVVTITNFTMLINLRNAIQISRGS